MSKIDNIINIYNKVTPYVLDGNALREDLFLKDLLFEFIKNLYHVEYSKDFFPPSRLHIPNRYSTLTRVNLDNWNSTKKKLNKLLGKKTIKLQGPENTEAISRIAASHLIESLYYLERSLFWFFNYKYNATKFHEVSGSQAQYYSLFFVETAILKFLGISIVHTGYIGKVRVKIDFNKAQIELNLGGKDVADHKNTKNLLISLFSCLDLSDYPNMEAHFTIEGSIIEEVFGVSDIELRDLHWDHLRQNRMDIVYNITDRKSDPFHWYYGVVGNYHKNVQEYCFLEGYERYNDGSEYFATSFVPDVYGSWGINEHLIGDLLRFLITALKQIKQTENFFNILSTKIKSGDFNEEAKTIILEWLQ